MDISSLKAAFAIFKYRKELDKIYKACIEFKEKADYLLCDLAEKYSISKGVAPVSLFYFSIFLIRDLYLNDGNNITKILDDNSVDKLLMTELYLMDMFCRGGKYDFVRFQEILNGYHMEHVSDHSTNSFDMAIIKMFSDCYNRLNEKEELVFVEPLSILSNKFQIAIKPLLI